MFQIDVHKDWFSLMEIEARVGMTARMPQRHARLLIRRKKRGAGAAMSPGTFPRPANLGFDSHLIVITRGGLYLVRSRLKSS